MAATITAVILTRDEEANVQRTLSRLRWVESVVVLDSLSEDNTVALAQEFANVRVVSRPFDSFASQFSAAADESPTNWVLALDADHVLTEELERELRDWVPRPGVSAYFAEFTYCIGGRPLRSSLYPARAVLFDRTKCRFVQEGHHQTLLFEGGSGWLVGRVLHDDRKPLRRWLADQERYARQEAARLEALAWRELALADRVRRLIFAAPPLVFVYTLVGRGLLRDGWAGWRYACERTVAELLLSMLLANRECERLGESRGSRKA